MLLDLRARSALMMSTSLRQPYLVQKGHVLGTYQYFRELAQTMFRWWIIQCIQKCFSAQDVVHQSWAGARI